MEIGSIIGIAIGGAFLIEGIAWALFPGAIRRSYQQIFETSDGSLQAIGLICAAFGTLCIAAVVTLGG